MELTIFPIAVCTCILLLIGIVEALNVAKSYLLPIAVVAFSGLVSALMEPAIADTTSDDAFLTAAELYIIFGTYSAVFSSGIN